MKKTRFTALFLGGMMLCLTAIPALAAEDEPMVISPAPTSQTDAITPPVYAGPDSLLYYGALRVTARDGQGRPTQLSLTTGQGTVLALTADENTAWVDSGKHTASDPTTLQDEEQVYVALAYDSAQAGAQLPSNGRVLAVLRNVPQDGGCAQYHVIGGIEQNSKGQYVLTTDNGGLLISAGEGTGASCYDGSALALADLKVGDRILAWYDVVLESYPGQTYATHIMRLNGPQLSAGTQITDGTQLTLKLNGKDSAITGVARSDQPLVPVAAVARELGLQVYYDAQNGDNGPLVRVEDDQFSVRIWLRDPLIFGTTKIKDAEGTTGPLPYGELTYVQAPGTTWAPASLFQMLGYTVTLDGTTLNIQ